MLFVILSYIPCVIGLLTVALIVLLKNPRSRLHLIFSALATVLGLWLFALFLGDLTISHDFSLWAVRAGSLIGILLGPLMVLFGLYFPVKIQKPARGLLFIIWFITVVFMALALTNIIIPDIEFLNHTAQPKDLNTAYTLQSLFIAITWLIGLSYLIRKFRRVGPRERAQIRLVFAGIITILVVNMSTGYIMTALGISNNYSNIIGSLAVLAFVATTAYAIVKYRLFDIRMAIVRLVGYVATVLIVALIYSVAIIVILGNLFGVDTVNSRPLAAVLIITTLFVSLTFQPLRKFIDKITLRIFYRHAYNEREVLDKLSDALVKRSTIDEIASSSSRIISEAIQPASLYFAVLADDGSVYKQLSSNQPNPVDTSSIVSALEHESKATIDYDLARPSLRVSLEALNAALILRLGKKSQPIGFIIFGHKRNGGIYTNQDIKLLEIAAKNLSIALENAKKYDQIAHFNETLREEVKHATARLRHANEELKSLDKLKDDFISMASHQFRTPASSVHQALQMVNNPKLSEEERKEMLKLAEINSAELVSLVSTMLSISRLQAGRFLIDKSLVDLPALIDKVLETTAIVADQKHTKLDFRRPDHAVIIEADSAKLREAITNYVENAIKYSPENSTVTIRIRSEDDRIYFEVTDQGMGVPEAERKDLFGKFYRAQNARQQQPDGNGIGLYVVRNIAEGHGGQAYYEPQENGSLFGLWLPLGHKERTTK
jgi:signal transduction histidine kinase